MQTDQRGCVIVVDDSIATANAMSEALRDAGHYAHAATGLEEVRALCHSLADSPRVALVDFHLRDGNGGEVASTLSARWPNIRVVYCTAEDPVDDSRLREALNSRGPLLLRKPFTLDAMLIAVQTAMTTEGESGRSSNGWRHNFA